MTEDVKVSNEESVVPIHYLDDVAGELPQHIARKMKRVFEPASVVVANILRPPLSEELGVIIWEEGDIEKEDDGETCYLISEDLDAELWSWAESCWR